jgi:riboflavin synthase alpha subunit
VNSRSRVWYPRSRFRRIVQHASSVTFDGISLTLQHTAVAPYSNRNRNIHTVSQNTEQEPKPDTVT